MEFAVVVIVAHGLLDALMEKGPDFDCANLGGPNARAIKLNSKRRKRIRFSFLVAGENRDGHPGNLRRGRGGFLDRSAAGIGHIHFGCKGDTRTVCIGHGRH